MSRREGKKIFGQDPALRQALEPYIAEQVASLELVRDVLAEKLPESDFPFRFTGSRSELVRFVRAFFLTGKVGRACQPQFIFKCHSAPPNITYPPRRRISSRRPLR